MKLATLIFAHSASTVLGHGHTGPSYDATLGFWPKEVRTGT